MLLNLRIRDFAIIDASEIELPPGFTVVTGETGAGKSILVDALMTALGGRASSEIVRTGAECAEVEALFDVSSHPVVKGRLEERDLKGDDPDTLLVRRVIGPKGKAKVVINGRLSTIATLQELVRGLVEISGQHEQQGLLHVENHLQILDSFGNFDTLRTYYMHAYDELRQHVSERDKLKKVGAEREQRADLLRYLLQEIERIDPQPGEDDALESERRRLAHAEKLQQGAVAAESLLYGEDGSAFDKVGKAVAEVATLAKIDPTLEGVSDLLSSARRDLEEAARMLQRYSDRVEVDPGRLAQVEERLTELQRLSRKHGGTLAEVISKRAKLMTELDALDHTDERVADLDAQIAATRERVLALALELHEARCAAAARLDAAIVDECADMELAGARFCTQVNKRGEVGASGFDEVEFLWSANVGESPRPLVKIASGGELSRLMLAVKRVLCHRDLVSLYVFDEVDTGLGGRAADAIGRKMQTVAQGHQAITITHLAPIAARADHHLLVRKEQQGERTVSCLEVVAGQEREEEIARMIDGAKITKATRQAAKAMLSRG